MGYEVVIYSFSLQYPGFLFPGKTQFSDAPAPKDLLIKTRLNSVNPFNWIKTGFEILAERPDHIVVRFWMPFMGPSLGTALRMVRWFSKKTCTITALTDNIVPHEKRFGDRFLSQYFVNACDDFVVMSRSVGIEIRSFLPVYKQSMPKIVRFAPHPIYDIYGDPISNQQARQLLHIPNNVPLVLFFGFIRAYKGLDLLLEALAQTPDVHALIAGECYEDWIPYQDLIAQYGLGPRVHLFTDFIADDRVKAFFCAADLVVQPYKTATQSGISQIAWHFEKPMVVTRVGGLGEIVSDGISGYVVDPNPEAIAVAISDFFQNDRGEGLKQGVISEKGRFSWERLVKTLLGE